MKQVKSIYIAETFGPLVGTRTVRYEGYWLNESEFVAVRSDGTRELRERTPHGSRLVRFLNEGEEVA